MRSRTPVLLVPMIGLALFCNPPMPSSAPLGGVDEGEPEAGLPDAAAEGAVEERATVAPVSPPTTERPETGPAREAGAAETDAAEGVDAAADASSASTAACDNQVGRPGDCSVLDATQGCLGAKVARKACEAVVDMVRPRVGERLVDCLGQLAQSGSICEQEENKRCLVESLRAACVEAESTALCESLGCDSIAADECETSVSALLPRHRTDFGDCLKSKCDVAACVGRLVRKVAAPGP